MGAPPPDPQAGLGGGTPFPLQPLPFQHSGAQIPGPGFQSGNAILGGTVLGGVGSLSGKGANF